MNKFLTLALLLSLPFYGYGKKEKCNKTKITKEVVSNEEDYSNKFIELVLNKKQMLPMIEKYFEAFMQQSNVQIPSSLLNKVATRMSDEFNSKEFTQEYKSIINKHFTNEEIKQIVDFYETPVGKKSITKLPEIAGEGAKLGIKIGEKVMTEFGPEFEKYTKKAESSKENKSANTVK